MTSEHGGSAPAWTRGLLAYVNMTDFNREQVPSCSALREAAVRHFRGVLHVSIVHVVLHCAWMSALNMDVCIAQDCIPHAHLYYTSGAASQMWGCPVWIENCALHFVPRHFGWASRMGYPPGKVVMYAPCKPTLGLHQGL